MALLPRDPEAFTLSRAKAPKPVKSRDYLGWLHRFPCVVCGATQRVEAAHVRYGSIPHGKQKAGLAQKPHDAWAIPLCAEHHRLGVDAQHNSSERQWWADRYIDPLTVCALLYLAFTVGEDDAAASAILAHARSFRSDP